MRTVLRKDRVRMVLRTWRSMLEEHWSKTAKRCLEDLVGALLKSLVPEDLLKTARAFVVPETGEV